MLGRKFPPKFFFPFPLKILQKNFPTYIFISHAEVSFITQSFYSQNSLIFSLSLTRPLTFTHTHTQPRRRRRVEPSPAQRRRRRGWAQPSTPLLLDLSTVNPYLVGCLLGKEYLNGHRRLIYLWNHGIKGLFVFWLFHESTNLSRSSKVLSVSWKGGWLDMGAELDCSATIYHIRRDRD